MITSLFIIYLPLPHLHYSSTSLFLSVIGSAVHVYVGKRHLQILLPEYRHCIEYRGSLEPYQFPDFDDT